MIVKYNICMYIYYHNIFLKYTYTYIYTYTNIYILNYLISNKINMEEPYNINISNGNSNNIVLNQINPSTEFKFIDDCNKENMKLKQWQEVLLNIVCVLLCCPCYFSYIIHLGFNKIVESRNKDKEGKENKENKMVLDKEKNVSSNKNTNIEMISNNDNIYLNENKKINEKKEEDEKKEEKEKEEEDEKKEKDVSIPELKHDEEILFDE